MKNTTSSSERVMLLLPSPLAAFVDELAASLSTPSMPKNRQDAIRETLAALQAKMQPKTPSRKSPSRKKVAAKN